MNICSFIGNLTRDPEVRNADGTNAMCKFGIAVSRRYRTASGEDKEEVLFLDCVAFGKTGSLIGQHFHKGRQIGLNGRLRLEQWEKDGVKNSKHVLLVEQFHFINDGKRADAAAAQSKQSGSAIDHSDIPF